MKLIYILLSMFLISCEDQEEVNKVLQWIQSSKKPVVCHAQYMNGITMSKSWLLIDSDGNMLKTPKIKLILPDTIK